MSRHPPAITQNADGRFLGRLLGEVIRSHGGPALSFNAIATLPNSG